MVAAPTATWIAFTVLALSTLVGCGDDWIADDQAGIIDLVPFFRGGATTADPTAGLPRTLPTTRGWATGNRVEAVDFGAVTVPRKFDAKGSALRIPDNAKVFPMYFFFDSSGRPLYSKPIYDARTGIWYMRGGHNPPLPTPSDPPAADPQRAAYYRNVNLLRPRGALFDADRSSSDFQRPVIDTLLDDPNYTGLWEIVEVTITAGGFPPDSIARSHSVSSPRDRLVRLAEPTRANVSSTIQIFEWMKTGQGVTPWSTG